MEKMKLGYRIIFSIIRAVIHALVFITKPIYRFLYEDETRLPKPNSALLEKSATELASLIRSGKVKSQDVCKAFIDQIVAINSLLNAVVADRFDEALEEAARVDAALESGDVPEEWSADRAPLLGVPVTVKEAFAVRGMPQSSGLLSRRSFVADRDAEVVARLRRAGAIPLASTNVSELCMWYESANLVYGRTRNAYHLGRTVGGSSGGEACLISAAGSVVGVGSDIGGSIRMPANFNGVFGHKPTAGVVPNDGQHPLAVNEAGTFLGTGPICRYAADLAPMLRIMAGPDGGRLKLDDHDGDAVDVKRLRYYYMEDDGGGSYLPYPVDGQIADRVRRAAEHFRSIGATVAEVDVAELRLSFEMWAAKMNTSGNESFCRLMADGRRPVNPFVELARWLVRRPRHTLPAIGLGIMEKIRGPPDVEAELVRICERLKSVFKELLGDDGVFLYPSHPVVAPYHNQPLMMLFNFAYTGVFNVLGLPVTQVPMGISNERVPIGIQVVSGYYNDHICLAVAKELEMAFGGWIPPF